MAKPDPTKDPEFQKVVRHFLTNPPKPHKSLGKKKRKTKKKTADQGNNNRNIVEIKTLL
jgi:hypothetical protein